MTFDLNSLSTCQTVKLKSLRKTEFFIVDDHTNFSYESYGTIYFITTHYRTELIFVQAKF